MLENPNIQPSWLVLGLFGRPSLNFILGTFGSKKTWLGLDLAVSVATGKPWLGYQPPAAAPGLFVDAAHGPSEIRRRLRSVIVAQRAPADTPVHFTSLGFCNFADPQETAALAAAALSFGAKLIVIDNPLGFGHLDLGRGTSSFLALQPIISSLRSLAESANAAVLVLLHTRHRRTALGAALCALGADHVLAVDSPFGESWLHLRTLAARD